jgi:hypothetical protein
MCRFFAGFYESCKPATAIHKERQPMGKDHPVDLSLSAAHPRPKSTLVFVLRAHPCGAQHF